MKFCFRLKKSSAEAYGMIQEASGKSVLPYATNFNGRQTPKIQPLRLHLHKSTLTLPLMLSHRWSWYNITSTIKNLQIGTHTLVTEKLNMRRVWAQWIPRYLYPNNRTVHHQICWQLEVMLQYRSSPILLIAGCYLHRFRRRYWTRLNASEHARMPRMYHRK